MANVLTSKRLQIDRATRLMVISVAVAVFILFFCIFSARSLSTVLSYQNRVISAQSTALNRLKTDISASQQLGIAYAKFNNTSGNNLLGQSVTGTGPNQGNNAKLVLDALPSVNDYPAMVVSLENLFSNQGVSVSGLSLTNTNTTATTAPATTSSAGGAVPIPLSFSVSGPLNNIESFVNHLNQSIIPIQFLQVTYSGAQNNNITMSVTAQVYYQPAIAFNISTEVVK